MHRVRVNTRILMGCALLWSGAGLAQEFDYDPRREPELRACDDHRDHGRTAQSTSCYNQLLRSSKSATVKAEAAWALGDVRRANEIFRDIVRADARAVRPRVRWGRLYLATHQYAEAAGLFREALTLDANDIFARLGMARLMSDRFEGNAPMLLTPFLEKNDGSVPAQGLLEARLLAARMDLDEGRYDAAEQSLNRALELAEQQKQPPLEAYELLAALDLLRGNENASRWIEQSLAYNPRFGGVYETLAHYEVMRRRYREADAWLHRAVEIQPNLWSAQAELGVNLLRLGKVDESRKALERAYSGDPFSATTVNTLRVLDTLKEFSVVQTRSPDIITRLDKKEADALRPYVEDVARSSIATFSKRYSFEPRQPVTVELYPNHDDFAVRTAGLPGIGLLGVTFGYLVAMDSPSGRSAGDFHWGSTLWHEMAHVFTLSLTDHRVPRWLSEGLSVFEEWRTGPTPGIAVSPRALDVFRDGKFLPVASLDEGFIRPDYEDQVQVSYMQSGLVCLFIEEQWGFNALAALLRQFTSETNTAAAIESTFKMPPAEFDKQFDAFLKQRFATILASPDDWKKSMTAAHEAAAKEKWPDVIAPARRAIEIFPDYTLDGSAYLLLARALDETGRRPAALESLLRYRERGGWNPSALRKLAQWLEDAGQAQQSLEVLGALVLIEPLDPSLHVRLGEQFNASGKAAESLREYRVLLALDAHDSAAAHFGIARALNTLGERAESRQHLLEALETAPHYRPAQDLLLQITGSPTQ